MMEKQLKEEYGFRLFYERSHQTFQSLDANACIVDVNPAWLTLFGYRLDEVKSCRFGRFLTPENRDLFQEYFTRVKQTGQGGELSCTMLTKAGERVPVHLDCMIAPDGKGRFQQALFLVDVDRGLQREGNGRTRSSAYLAAVLEALPVTIFLLEQDGRLVTWNQQLENVYGYTKEELDGRDAYSLVAPEDVDAVRDGIQHTLSEGSAEIELSLLSKSGERLPYHVVGARVVIDQKPFIIGSGYSIAERKGFITELSMFKLLEDRLLESEQLAATGRLAASVAHEIKNPLQSMKTHLSLLKTALPTDSKKLRNYDYINESINRVDGIVQQLLKMYRSSYKAHTPVDINTLFEEVIQLTKDNLLIHHITLHTEFAEDLPTIVACPLQLHQVFLNLLLNAIESIGKEGTIHVATYKEDNRIIIKIRDNGVGIARGCIDHIFDPFFSTKKRDGVGLGLFVCKELIGNHAGTLSVASSEEKGSIFTISLPISTGDASAP